MRLKSWRGIVFVLAIVLIIVPLVGIAIWMQAEKGPSELALKALQSDSQVTVFQKAGYITFEPQNQHPSLGFIFYPGAGVDYQSYAPIMEKIAEQGYFCALLSMPLNIAFLNPNFADEVIEKYPQIENWVMGGHSLGGVVAANYAAGHPSVVGIVFLAAYPANAVLRDKDIPVLSIYGSKDGLTTPQDIADSRSLLPSDTSFVEIKGGNHAQFGSYGFQDGDKIADISPEEQWSQSVNAIIKFIQNIENNL